MSKFSRRVHPRILQKYSVVVTIIESRDAPQLERETFFCSSADVSVGGVKLRTMVVPPSGARVRLLVALSSPVRSFALAGRVAWLGNRESDGRTSIGVDFSDTPDDTYAHWREVVERMIQGD